MAASSAGGGKFQDAGQAVSPSAYCCPSANSRREVALEVPIVGGTLEVRAEDPATWRKLSAGVGGLRVPRTTAVLSALWPDRHAIMDWHALLAAIALAGTRLGWDHSLADPESTDRALVSWDGYSWYREVVLECVGHVNRPPVAVERALYQLGRESPDLLGGLCFGDRGRHPKESVGRPPLMI
jgi:hypothetical protein